MKLKIYYESWQYQCCGDAFGVGDAIKWGVVKFDAKDWIFKDADYAYEAHDEIEREVSGRVTAIWAISYSYRHDEKLNAQVPASYVLQEVDDSNASCSAFLAEVDEY